MSEQEAIAYIKTWDLTEAAKVLRWYEEEKLLRPCDCDTIVAIETENLSDENAKLREYVLKLEQSNIVLSSDNCDLLNDMADMQFFIDENRKLRELVKALDWCTENFDIRDKCDQCPLTQRSALDPECEAIMRELGMKGSDA